MISSPQPRPPRVLLLASYFPKPGNPLMGAWALPQAQAFLRRGMQTRVVSCTSWVPRWVARLGLAKAWADCPPSHHWGELQVDYPRWLLYQFGAMKRSAYQDPRRQQQIAWQSVRRRLLHIIRDFQPDVLFAQGTLPNGDLAERLQRETGLPFVVGDVDFDEIRDCERFPRRRACFERVARRAACMVAISSPMEADLRRLFPGVAARTVHWGVDPVPPGGCNPRPAELAERRIVFSAGFFYERKGFPMLVRAFAQVAAHYPRAILRIAGDGDDRPAVEQAIRETGLQERVQLLGALPNAHIREEMSWCDVFALPSRDEPWGVVYTEAMSAGKPVVCCRDCGITDIVRDGTHGLIVTPRDAAATARALDRLLEDEPLRRRMGHAGRQVMEQLTWDANAAVMQDVFEQAAERAPSRASVTEVAHQPAEVA